MSLKSHGNYAFGIIISLLLIILGILLILLFTQPSLLKRPNCKFSDNSLGVCINISECVMGSKIYNEVECSSVDGYTCCSIDDVILGNEKKFTMHKNFKFLNATNCGTVNSFQGSNSSSEEKFFNYIVDLGIETENGDVNFKCSGSLINEHFILTTAKCALPTETGFNLSVIRLSNYKDCHNNNENCVDIKKFKIISHEEFDSVNLTNDIALIKLVEPLNLDHYEVMPICLPFGIEKVPSNMYGIILNRTNNSHFISLPECYTNFKNFVKFNNSSGIKLRPLYEESQFCAQASDKNSDCIDILGTPLQASTLIRGKSHLVQYGLLSYSSTFCELPKVYTKISNYLNWILDNIDT